MLQCGRRVVMPTPTESRRLLSPAGFTVFSHRLNVHMQMNVAASPSALTPGAAGNEV